MQPWDPFARTETATLALARPVASASGRRARFTGCGSARTSCPTRLSSRTRAAHAAAAGPNRWNRQQGLYIYRGDRLIQSGGLESTPDLG